MKPRLFIALAATLGVGLAGYLAICTALTDTPAAPPAERISLSAPAGISGVSFEAPPKASPASGTQPDKRALRQESYIVDFDAIPLEYTRLPFYIPENSLLYAEFSQSRPDLDPEAVVWMVNAFVHVPFYSEIQVNYSPNPLLITPAFRLPYDFAPTALVPVNHDDCPHLATPETVAAFREMRYSARAAGFNLSVVSGHRTSQRQLRLWNNGGRRDGRIARPYHSEHQTGRALDFWGPGGRGLMDSNSPVGRWAAANAHHYGFIVRYRAEATHITGYIYEPWHFTYVGLEISLYMHNNNILSLEEFVGRNPDLR